MDEKPQIKSKSQKKVVTAQYVDQSTNKLVDLSLKQLSTETDFNFHKIWIKDLTDLLELIGGQKVKVFNHILLNMNSDNTFIGTIRGMAEELKLSIETVTKSIKLLKDSGNLRMLQNGIYMINPDLIIRGKSIKRQIVRAKFYNEDLDIDLPKSKLSKREKEHNDLTRAFEDKFIHEARNEAQIEDIKKRL